MKTIIYKTNFLLCAFFMVIFTLNATAQQSSDQCTISGGDATIALIGASGGPLTVVKSGLDFNLNLTVNSAIGCNVSSVIINTSANLTLSNAASNYQYPFVPTTNINEYENGTNLPGGTGINIPFQFLPGVTCDGELGTFKVKIIYTCADNSKYECILNVSLKAEAKNYWKVEKKHVWGNLSGGAIYWDVVLSNTNGNPGIGDYNLNSGSITDNVTSGAIISVSGGGLSGLTGLNTSTASWNTGLIPSTTNSPIVYHVQTYSCDPSGTVVKNCVKYNFCLGKEVKMIANPDWDIQKAKNSDSKISSVASIPTPKAKGPILLPQKPCCDRATGEVCASVTLTGTGSYSTNFSKSLTYGNNLNYAQGCQGEYRILVSNNGNIPLNNINISDAIPTGIDVTKITVSDNGSGVGMDYTMTGLGSGVLAPGGYPLNTGVTQIWDFTSSPLTNPATFTLSTTGANALTGGYIEIRIKFTITAPATTYINNCANLTFTGTYNGWGNWCTVTLPPLPNASSQQDCAPFTVEQPKAIPGVRKCIRSGQQSFSVGDVIPFRIVVSNHGAADFSGNLTDFLGLPQNLSLVPGSVNYSWGVGSFSPYSTMPSCISAFSNNSNATPSWLSVTQQTSQNLGWSISNMPENCDLNSASYLVIEFDATVLPQSFGQYCNSAKLGSLHSDACYNVMRVAQIKTTKQVSTAFVEPGQSFNYIILVKNYGSVALKDIRVEDQLPTCVTYNSRSARKLDINGNLLSVTTVSPGPTTYTFSPTLILQPGESVELTITVIRKANDQGEQCCNPKAEGFGTSNDVTLQLVHFPDGPVCVKSSLCCAIKDLNVQFFTTTNNGGIVPVFLITGGAIPVQEIEISLIDYHAEYSNVACKPANMGNLFGHIQPFVGNYGTNYFDFNSLPFSGSPSLQLQTVVNPVNNSLTWTGLTPISLGGGWNFNGLIALNFIAPDIVNLSCCTGKVYYCFKVRVKDVNCNVCEKIVCGSFEIPKEKQKDWKNENAKEQFKLQSLKNNQSSERNTDDGRSFLKMFKKNE